MVMLPFLLALAASSAAGAPPADAAEPVEAEIEGAGTVDVAAQGYRVSVFFGTQPMAGERSPPSAAARQKAISTVKALGPVTTAVCGGDLAKIGFIGNEAAGGPALDETELEEQLPFEPYTAAFASLDQAKRASAILAAAGAKALAPPQAVLFRCDAANHGATVAALAASRAKAGEYAAILGLKVGGVRRLSDRQGWGALLMRAQTQQVAAAPSMVRVTATVTVTYVLEP